MNTILMGAFGEQTAAKYLRENGYRILSANYRTGAGELDIVAEKGSVLSFVEVKTRAAGGLTEPKDAVDYRKQENLKAAAASYLSRYNYNLTPRFDIIEVLVNNGEVIKINHIKNAF